MHMFLNFAYFQTSNVCFSVEPIEYAVGSCGMNNLTAPKILDVRANTLTTIVHFFIFLFFFWSHKWFVRLSTRTFVLVKLFVWEKRHSFKFFNSHFLGYTVTDYYDVRLASVGSTNETNNLYVHKLWRIKDTCVHCFFVENIKFFTRRLFGLINRYL